MYKKKKNSSLIFFILLCCFWFSACSQTKQTEVQTGTFSPTQAVSITKRFSVTFTPTPKLTSAIGITISPTVIENEIVVSPIPTEVVTTDVTISPTGVSSIIELPTPIPTIRSEITSTPTLIPTSTPTLVPTESITIEERKIIAIDAGHQGKGNYDTEPLGPGSSQEKTKVSSGTQGVSSKVPEYELTLEISLQLRDALELRGYEVVMIRETNDVNISNAERAAIANEKADIFLRIHADGSTNESANGISILYPSANNPFVAYLHEESKALSASILKYMCESTQARNRGIIERDDLTGINWCEIPVALIEMGFMTNPEEDKKMQTAEYQALLVEGICNGVEAYLNAE